MQGFLREHAHFHGRSGPPVKYEIFEHFESSVAAAIHQDRLPVQGCERKFVKLGKMLLCFPAQGIGGGHDEQSFGLQ